MEETYRVHWERIAVALGGIPNIAADMNDGVESVPFEIRPSSPHCKVPMLTVSSAQQTRERAGWALGILSTGALAGNLVGPLVGGFLPTWVGIRGTFFVGGVMIAVTALLVILLVREDFRRESDTKNRVTAKIGHLGVSADSLTRVAGIVMAASALGSVLTAARLGALADRIGGWNVIMGCLVATGLVMLPQAFVTQWWQLAILRVLMGMTIAGLLPAIAKLVRQSVDERESGKMLGYLQSAQFAGQVIGPLIGGPIGVHIGLPAVFFVTGALLVSCAGLNQWVRSRNA